MPEIHIAQNSAVVVQKWAKDRIESHRNDLESEIGGDLTWTIRGRIYELRRLIRALSPDSPDPDPYMDIDVEI